MPRARSAAVVLYRRRAHAVEVLLVHPGGPFWARKDDGAWSFPKGEFDADEEPVAAARREFAEETGTAFDGPLQALTPVVQAGGKIVHPFAAEGDLDTNGIASNTFELEWPPKSGRTQSFPEVDRGEWFDVATAVRKLVGGQRPILVELARLLGGEG